MSYTLLFESRINRKAYIAGSLCVLLLLGIGVISYSLIAVATYPTYSNSLYIVRSIVALIMISYLLVILGLAMFYQTSLTIKRLHDLGISGWFALLIHIPIFSTLFWVYLSLKTGDKAANKYGATPSKTLKVDRDIIGIKKLPKINPNNHFLSIIYSLVTFALLSTILFGTRTISPSQGEEAQIVHGVYAFFGGCLCIFIALVLNMRKVPMYVFGMYILALYILLLINRGSEGAIEYYKSVRNIGLATMLIYLVMHSAVHATCWLFDKSRKIFTKAGVGFGVLVLVLSLFGYGLVVMLPANFGF